MAEKNYDITLEFNGKGFCDYNLQNVGYVGGGFHLVFSGDAGIGHAIDCAIKLIRPSALMPIYNLAPALIKAEEAQRLLQAEIDKGLLKTFTTKLMEGGVGTTVGWECDYASFSLTNAEPRDIDNSLC